MEYYSAINRIQLLKHTIKWMALKIAMLDKKAINQANKCSYCMIPNKMLETKI